MGGSLALGRSSNVGPWSERSAERSWGHLHPEFLTLVLTSLMPQQKVPFLLQVCQKQARMHPGQALPLCLWSAESVTQSQPALERGWSGEKSCPSRETELSEKQSWGEH